LAQRRRPALFAVMTPILDKAVGNGSGLAQDLGEVVLVETEPGLKRVGPPRKSEVTAAVGRDVSQGEAVDEFVARAQPFKKLRRAKRF